MIIILFVNNFIGDLINLVFYCVRDLYFDCLWDIFIINRYGIFINSWNN